MCLRLSLTTHAIADIQGCMMNGLLSGWKFRDLILTMREAPCKQPWAISWPLKDLVDTSDHTWIYHVCNLIFNLDPSRTLGETKTPFQFFQSSGARAAFYFLFSPSHLNTQSCWSFQDGKNSLFIVSRHQPRGCAYISIFSGRHTRCSLTSQSSLSWSLAAPPPPPHF